MGLFSMTVLALAMMFTLGQFQDSAAAEWVKLAEQTGREFKADRVNIHVNLRSVPSAMVISYSSLLDTHYDLSIQNKEMENVAKYLLQNSKDQKKIDEVQVTRSETHGRGCFQQTYVGHLTYPNPLRKQESEFPLLPPRR